MSMEHTGPLEAPTAAAFSPPEIHQELPEDQGVSQFAISDELDMPFMATLFGSNFTIEQAKLRDTWTPRSFWKLLAYSWKMQTSSRQRDQVEYALTLGQALFNLGNRRRVRVLMASSAGGSAKTTTTAYMATTFSHWLGKSVAVVDNNPNYDPIDLLLGLQKQNTVSVRELAEMPSLQLAAVQTALDQKRSALQLMQLAYNLQGSSTLEKSMAWTPHGVGLIASDGGDRNGRPYDYHMSERVINTCSDKIGHTFINSGNAVNDPVIHAAIHCADVVVIPTIPTDFRIGGAKDALTNLRQQEPAKIQNAIILVSGVEPGHHVEEYRSSMGLSGKHILLGTPFDQRLSQNMAVDLMQTSLLTIIAYLELSVAVMLVAECSQNGKPTPASLDIRPGHVVPLPGGRIPYLPWAPK